MDTTGRTARGRAAGLVVAGVVAGAVLAGYAGASAQPSPSPSPSQPEAPTAPKAGGGGHRPGHGMGMGMGMGIHGEFVAPAPNGGYQTIATQRGEVTAVSATSLTVRSEDGFSRTYAVDDNTLVNAGNEGIADVETGDQVSVVAIVAGDKATAVDVRDGTQVKRLRERWAPRRGAPDGTAPGTPPGAPSAPVPSGTA